jgi:hypothetical protein
MPSVPVEDVSGTDHEFHVAIPADSQEVVDLLNMV